MALELKTKKWGNSLGVIIPSYIVTSLNIKPEENIIVSINKNGNLLRELFGSLKFNKSSEKLIKETRKDLKSKWLK
ncbi:MAG: hypothetical protein ABFQ65_03095 [Nanoarchaeota archaeon]